MITFASVINENIVHMGIYWTIYLKLCLGILFIVIIIIIIIIYIYFFFPFISFFILTSSSSKLK